VLAGVDLAIAPGEYVYVCGASGSGKSTLAYLLNGLVPHFFGGTLEGRVTVAGLDTSAVGVSDLFAHVGLVLQNSDAQLFNPTVESEIAFGLESMGVPAREIDARVEEAAGWLGIEPLLPRQPHTLSGGEKRLAAIAAVLALRPQVLVVDEPYAHLDWEADQRIGTALRQINRSGTTVVVVEHFINEFIADADRCIVLDRGRVRFDGDAQGGQEALRQCRLLPIYPRRSSPAGESRNALLQVSGLGHASRGRTILEQVSLEIREKEITAIVGRNGSGKTTLIKHFNGLLRPTAGEVHLRGEPIGGRPVAELAAQVGLSFQNANDQFFKYRVQDELEVGPKVLGREDPGWINELCRIFALEDLLPRSPFRLSEGEKKRVAFASVLAGRPELLILDEPTAGQDGRFRVALAEVLAELRNRGVSTVVVTHDLGFARAVADRWILLERGRVVAAGDPTGVAASLAPPAVTPSGEVSFGVGEG